MCRRRINCRAPGGTGGGVRQRWPLGVREADADPAGFHPSTPRGDDGGAARAHQAAALESSVERDYGWFGALMDEHYAGDDTNLRLLTRGILTAYAGISVEDFEE